MSYRILVQGFKIPNLIDEYKPFFLEREANVETLQKFSPYIWVFYKFVLKSVKSLNRMLWATEYWFKALKWEIWLTNTKAFFWESLAKIETLQNFSSYIWVFYKFVLKSVKSLNRMSWATEYWFKALKWEIWLTNTKPFFLEKRGSRWKSPKTFFLYLSFL